MKEAEVPQDAESSTYGGERKLLYATDNEGNYSGVNSSGWTVEAEATQAALQQLREQAQQAWQRSYRGESSPLEYHMYCRRMDLALLAQATGLFKWRIRRHFKPRVFSRLPSKLLQRYADALGLPVETLAELPASFEAGLDHG